jgi:hypothetical protein
MPPRPARVVCLKCSGAAVPPAAQRANPCEVFSCVASRCERQAIYGWLCALPGDFEGSAIDLRGARLGDGLRKRSREWSEKTFEEVLVLRHVGASLGILPSAGVYYRRAAVNVSNVTSSKASPSPTPPEGR